MNADIPPTVAGVRVRDQTNLLNDILIVADDFSEIKS